MSTIEQTMAGALQRLAEAVANAEMDGMSWDSRAFDLEFLSEEVNDALYGADYLGALEALEFIDKFVDHVRTALVITCRSTGDSWDQIGDAMGRDRQWAWRSYHRQADYSDELDEKALAEFESAVPNFEAWGWDPETVQPEMRKAVSLLEAEARRRYERVRRAVQLMADTRRRALTESEKKAERAGRPGRRPGPQSGAANKDGEDS